MADRPILMSAPMVRACLDGSKTQTRRIVKPQPNPDLENIEVVYGVMRGCFGDHHRSADCEFVDVAQCPYGLPGDLLWVRETWGSGCRPHPVGDIDGIEFKADMPVDEKDDLPLHDIEPPSGVEWPEFTGKWRPSIFMPRWVSRLTLEIVDVRVEQLNDCSEADAIAEGAKQFVDPPHDMQWWTHGTSASHPNALPSYRHLWETINGLGSWDENPWVWVISFKAHHKNIDEFKKERS